MIRSSQPISNALKGMGWTIRLAILNAQARAQTQACSSMDYRRTVLCRATCRDRQSRQLVARHYASRAEHAQPQHVSRACERLQWVSPSATTGVQVVLSKTTRKYVRCNRCPLRVRSGRPGHHGLADKFSSLATALVQILYSHPSLRGVCRSNPVVRVARACGSGMRVA